MAKCTIINEPVVPKLPDKVVLEMTGDEAMKLMAGLDAFRVQDHTGTPATGMYNALRAAIGHDGIYEVNNIKVIDKYSCGYLVRKVS